MGGTQGGAFFLDQDIPNQGRKAESWRPGQKESAQESQTGSWRVGVRRVEWVAGGVWPGSDGYRWSWWSVKYI